MSDGNEDEKEDGRDLAIGCALCLVLLPASLVLQAFLLTYLWGWYAVPLGLHGIGIPQAFGLCLLADFFKTHRVPKKNETSRFMAYKTLMGGVVAPTLIWFVGWLVHFFM